MKNAVKMCSLALLLIGMASSANAQFRQSVYLNGILPTGGFAKDVSSSQTDVPLEITEIGKDAALGIGASYRVSYRFDVGVGEVAPLVEASLFWNMIGSDWREKYGDKDYTTPTYFNVPILVGVSYFYDELWQDITPFGEFGIGADWLKITREGKKADESNGTLYYAYKGDIAMAWMIGAGAMFGRHVSVGLYYYGLGKHYVDYTDKTIDKNAKAKDYQEHRETGQEKRQERSVGELALRIGFHF
ncbi:MAG: hypothetical protein IJU19_06780 [Bacteroidales bacterium]|nr:hypothetical protein [Bacteroidales bacterium]